MSAFCYVNGKRHMLPDNAASTTLLQWLRGVGLTGTKLGCGEGGCGACTVMVSRKRSQMAEVEHLAVNACLCPLYSIAECHVVTVEGIGNVRDGLHPVQQRLADAHGSQCGFCTPGFVMSMYALLRSRTAAPSRADIETAISGNLCRCTGYRPILDAFNAFASPVEASVYTNEAVQAHSNGNAAAVDAAAEKDGGTSQRRICPSSGQPCDCGKGTADGGSADATNGCWGPNGGIPAQNGHVAGQNGKATAGRHPLTGRSEPIFPPELADGAHPSLKLEGADATWERCTTLQELLDLKQESPHVRIVGGNTELGVEMNVKKAVFPHLVDTQYVPQMNGIAATDRGLEVGGAASLSQLVAACLAACDVRPSHETSTLRAVLQQLHWFAGVQVRNVATLAGNIVTGSPISDLNPLWAACGATFVLQSAQNGIREVPARNFFLGYRKVDLQPSEVLVTIVIPWNEPFEYVRAFKQAHRRDDDIALVNAGMRLAFEEHGGQWTIKHLSLAYGGVGPSVVQCPVTADRLSGAPLDAPTVKAALATLREDVSVPEQAPGGMGAYRTALTSSFLYKFLVRCALDLQKDAAEAGLASAGDWIDDAARSAVHDFERPAPKGVQFYAQGRPADIVGQPEKHRAADLQVSGEAKYTDDVPLPADALHAALLTSTVAHARLLSVDASEALATRGVHGFYSAKDVPGDNAIGPNALLDEQCFAVDTVTCIGQVIGVLVADTQAIAKQALTKIKVAYEELPAIISIEDAIAAESFAPSYDRTITTGDPDAAFESADVAVTVEGVARMGGQEHFYLEPQCNLVLPVEHDEYVLWASTQDVNKHQKLVARVLGIPQHKLVCKTKRLGGGFGGKETRGIFLHCASAVAAYHTGRPVSLVLDRQDDMQMTGHRHAFCTRYRVAAAADGRIIAAELDMFNNMGNSLDLSIPVMDRAMLSADGAFKLRNARLRGRLCATNIASNTAFRGFGGPQGMLTTNMWMDHVARALGRPVRDVQAVNAYVEGDVTHFGQALDAYRLPACVDEVLRMSDYDARARSVSAFNAQHRHRRERARAYALLECLPAMRDKSAAGKYGSDAQRVSGPLQARAAFIKAFRDEVDTGLYRKRGIALLPTKFGISFTFLPFNQAGSLVHIYADGSVRVVHGGIEMGQGLHTKMCQVAAQALRVPLKDVHIAETATDKLPNSSPTAASASSDLYGAAVLDACTQLNDRLEPIRKKLGAEASMAAIASEAWMQRVDLCAHGFYRTPDITGAGGHRPFHYFVFGAAVAEVEIDCLTGDWHNLRTDIAMDVGNPINPAIDVGQVEGGFVQGMGWTCLEELKWGDREHTWIKPGRLFTNGPGAYKIPTANDIPLDLRVRLLENVPNKRVVHSSKAIGEPPLHLGASVFFALKEAIYAARSAAGVEGFFQLDSPVTPERIRMACIDDIAQQDSAHYVPSLSC